MANAIDISVVQSVTNLLKKDILISPALLKNSELEKIGVETITGVTHIESQFINLAYGGGIRAYDMTKTYTEADAKEVSKIIERRMKVYLSFKPVYMNLQEFKEKEPFPTTDKVDEASLARLPQTQFTLLQAGEMYGQGVINAFFHGKRSLGSDDPYGIYDGIFEQVAKDMTSYEDEEGHTIPVLISEANGNLIKTDPLTDPTSDTDTSAYDAFETFLDGVSDNLTNNPDGFVVLVDSKKAPYIFRAYWNKYKNLQGVEVDKIGYKFFTHPNAVLIPTPLMGSTNTMIATRRGNLQFGIESERDGNNVIIRNTNFDPNHISMWIQSYQGTRLLNPTKSHFAINCDSAGKLYDATPYEFADLQLPADASDGGGTESDPGDDSIDDGI